MKHGNTKSSKIDLEISTEKMSFIHSHPKSILVSVLLSSLLLNPTSSINLKLRNASVPQPDSSWSPAAATWYGAPTGAGSTGGACGYGSAVEQAPFSSMISAGGSSLFKNGQGCGACYQVKCTKDKNAECSGNPVAVVITDDCPGGPCATDSVHFDLSGAAFGAMADQGRADNLRKAGVLQIQYQRVPCKYPGVHLSFHVDAGSNPYYLALVIEYVSEDGELAAVELKQSGQSSWLPMQRAWGAVWKYQAGSAPLAAPFSIQLTTLLSNKIIQANNVIPANWQPAQTYQSII